MKDAGWGVWRFLRSVFASCVFVAAFFGYVAFFGGGSASLIPALLCTLIGQFIATFVHESGHAVAAWCCRWRVIVFAVRPIAVQLHNSEAVWLQRRFKVGRGGWVATVPRSPVVDTSQRWSIVLIAGPAASLVFAIAIAGGVALPPATSSGAVPDWHAFAFGLCLQSLYSALFSLLPGTRGYTSDGGQLWALARSPGNYAANRALIWIQTLLTYKVRVRDIPGWLVADAAKTATSDGIATYIATLEIARALDRKPRDPVQVRGMLDAFRAAHGEGAWLSACDAYFTVVEEHDAVAARAVLERSPHDRADAPMWIAAEAAVAAATGDVAQMRNRLGAMRQELTRESPFPDPTFRDIEREVEALPAASGRAASILTPDR